MTPHLSPLPAEPFSVSRALFAGATRGQLRTPALSAPFWGVRSLTIPRSTLDRAHAYATRMRSDAVFSHETAAALWGIWFPNGRPHPAIIEVTVPATTSAPGGRGVRSHRRRLTDADVTTVHGLRVTTPLRTWLDLGARWAVDDLVAAGDNITWFRRRPAERVSLDRLAIAVEESDRFAGLPALRSAAPLVTGRADAHPEVIIRLRAARAGLPAAVVNEKIYDERGRFVAQPDLKWPRYRLAFDYEGEHHGRIPAQWEKDIARVPRLHEAGWAHLRGARAAYFDSTDLIRQLSRMLREGGWDGFSAT
jgi:hypothetical protein